MLKKQKKDQGEAVVTTVLFDDNYELLHDRINVKGISPITEKDYYVRGCTALLDAISTAAKFGIDSDRASTRLNYEALSNVVSEFRSCRTIDESWKEKIDEDFARRGGK